jgi:hypothetical protein
LAAGIFSKIHHTGGVGVLIAAQGKTFRVIRVVRGQPGLVGRKLKADSRATEMCKRGGGMALSHGGFATFA